MGITRTHLTEQELEWLYRLLGHHMTGGGMSGTIYDVLANKIGFMEVEDKGPLNIALSESHIYGHRILIKEVEE